MELTQAAKFWPELQPRSRRVNILGALWCGVVWCGEVLAASMAMSFHGLPGTMLSLTSKSNCLDISL